METYENFLNWLDREVPADHSNDLVALHRNFYETGRARWGLPAQIMTFGFRDWVIRRKGGDIPGVPLDSRLYSVKSVSTLSVSGLHGRIIVPFMVAKYEQQVPLSTPARLICQDNRFELWAATTPFETDLSLPPAPGLFSKEETMSTESVISRLGRLIAGMAHAAVDSAEGAQPIAVLEQAIRDIDKAAEDVRVELGKATAERHRLQIRREELSSELLALDGQVKVAVLENRDDLASVGIDRQLDIEAQIRVLDTLIADVDEKIAKATDMMDAVKASRKEAEQRLYEFRQSENHKGNDPAGHPSLDALSKAASRIEKAENAASRITGIPLSTQKKDVQAIEALKALSREHAVKERLARIKADTEN